MSKVTEWYPASVKPVREGWYEVRRKEYDGELDSSLFVTRVRMLKFRAGDWSYGKNSGPGIKNGDPAVLLESDGDKWRGLAEKPA